MTNSIRLIEGLASILRQQASKEERIEDLGFPYLDNSHTEYIADFISRNVGCTRVPGDISQNPYATKARTIYCEIAYAFHITLYEMVDSERYPSELSAWKTGQLFDDKLAAGNYLRESCITVC